MIDFTIARSAEPCPAAERERLLADPGFGRVFTDHMITIDWAEGQGWHDAALLPYGPLSLDPATQVLHYAQEIFEGTKAYLRADGTVVTFRPWANAARFNASARRMVLPELPEELFVRSLELLIGADRDWVPGAPGSSLYLRPFMIGTQRTLVADKPPASARYLVIASPAGAYFSGGVAPVTVWLSERYTRAAPGGTGAAKCGGNYAAALAGQLEAMTAGCDQTVWLDAAEHRWVEEMGGMNLFFLYGAGPQPRLVTPPLTGTLLPGITRDSLLTLAPDLGIPVQETALSAAQWRADTEAGLITEVFACGTAAVITPVGKVKSADGEWTISDGSAGPVTMQLREALLGIQHGTAPDPYGWIHPIA
ncbi:MAG TPA: branched-chain amino acid aminotransferase [Streptosporangiaceae bacterium]|jgi:branched-chain amino acid aminotransferase